MHGSVVYLGEQVPSIYRAVTSALTVVSRVELELKMFLLIGQENPNTKNRTQQYLQNALIIINIHHTFKGPVDTTPEEIENVFPPQKKEKLVFSNLFHSPLTSTCTDSDMASVRLQVSG